MGFLGTNSYPMVINSAGISGSNKHYRIQSSVTPQLILSASDKRQYASVFNHGNASLYISFGEVPTTSMFNVKLGSGSFFEIQTPIWRAEVYGVWDAENGFAMVNDVSGSL